MRNVLHLLAEEFPAVPLVLFGDRWSDKASALARALGAEGEIGEPFGCVLPRHRHAARLVEEDQRLKYECPDRPRLELGHVRAEIAYRHHLARPAKVLCCRFYERLEYEAGLLVPRPPVMRIPDAGRERRLALGIALLLGLRDARSPLRAEPFTFARSFSRAWCGLSDDDARYGMKAIEDAGVIKRAGKNGYSILWTLGEAGQ